MTEETVDKTDNSVSDSELNTLRDQLRQKDEERKALETELSQERKARQETAVKLGDETTQRFSAQETAIENAIVAATSEIDGLEKQQTTLMEEGKFAEASKISRLIASAQYRLDGANNAKGQLVTYKQQALQQAEQAKNDPLAKFSESSKSWIRKNPGFLNDNKFRARAIAAHNMCEAEDIAVDSPEYFRRLDEAVNPTHQQRTEANNSEDEGVETQQEQVRVSTQRLAPKSSTAAPVSRGGSQAGTTTSGKRIQLTADEAEAAIISFPNIPTQEAYKRYADNKQKLKEAGKL